MLDDHIAVFGIQLNHSALAVQFFTGDQRIAGYPEVVQNDFAALAAVVHRVLHKHDGLHGRVQFVPHGLVHKPDITLIARTAPGGRRHGIDELAGIQLGDHPPLLFGQDGKRVAILQSERREIANG